jgi:hypothetical protein
MNAKAETLVIGRCAIREIACPFACTDSLIGFPLFAAAGYRQ